MWTRHCPPPRSLELDGADLDSYKTRLDGQDTLAPRGHEVAKADLHDHHNA